MRFPLPARYFLLPAALAAAALFLVSMPFSGARPVEALTNCTVSDLTFDSEEQQFLTLINQYRAQNGLGALTVSTNLNRASSWLANDMATKNYMDHTDSLGRSFGTRIQQCDVQYSSAGENIAAGYTSASAVFAGWQASSGHNANMLGSAYRQIGIARVYGAASTYGWYWATDFSSVDDGTRVTGSSGTNPTATATKTSTAVPTATKTPAATAATPTRTSTPVATATNATTGAKAVMTSPAPGSQLLSTTVTFSWSAGTNAAEYFLYVGTTPGSNNKYGRSQGLNRSVTLSGLPSNGSLLYVRLWTRVGSTWSYNDYTYRSR